MTRIPALTRNEAHNTLVGMGHIPVVAEAIIAEMRYGFAVLTAPNLRTWSHKITTL